MKAIWKISFVFLLTVGGIFMVSLNTLAAAKPYQYTFEKDNTTFNGISSINKLVIHFFDKDITATVANNNIAGKPIFIVQKGEIDRINIMKDVTISGKTLTVSFKNLDFIDYTDPEKLEYELVIDKETLQFDQLEEYRIPFNIYDILPGFKSTFVDTDASTINNNIFKINAPRDVYVHVPKVYIRGIETIHHYDGILPDLVSGEQGDIIKDPINNSNAKKPALTNIDILADEEATRLKVEFGGNSNHSRDLARHPDVEGFTMGQAGINEITDNQVESTNEFSLRAYNDYGRFLEQRKFKLRVDDPKNDYKINDYLPEPTREFGQTYSLYELMDDPELLNTIIERIPVSQLDSLGITYKMGSDKVSVMNEEELLMALANPKVKTIKLPSSLTLASDLVVNRNVTIEGSSSVTGNIILQGLDITARLNSIMINGALTVDVGTNGTAILDNSSANHTTILSAGENSIHLNHYKSTNGITLMNTKPIRIVTSAPITKDVTMNGNGVVTLEGDFNKVILNGPDKVTLSGNYTLVEVKKSTVLTRTKDLKINTLYVNDNQILSVVGEGGKIAGTVIGVINYETPITSELPELEIKYTDLMLGTTYPIESLDGYEVRDVVWKVINPEVFGVGSTLKYDNGTLSIANLNTEEVTEFISQNVWLQGVNSTATFEVKLPVKIFFESEP